MTCDVCGSAGVVQIITGTFCQKHWSNDTVIRAAYFAYLANGGKPHEFISSQEKRDAVKRATQEEVAQ